MFSVLLTAPSAGHQQLISGLWCGVVSKMTAVWVNTTLAGQQHQLALSAGITFDSVGQHYIGHEAGS